MKKTIATISLIFSAACTETDRPGINEPTPGIDVTAQVNLQLGDTPVGEQPGYIVTGTVGAKRGTTPLAASIDSVVIHYKRNGGTTWTRITGRSTLPFSGSLPFVAQANDTYEVRATLYARASSSGDIATATDEWLASGRAYGASLRQ